MLATVILLIVVGAFQEASAAHYENAADHYCGNEFPYRAPIALCMKPSNAEVYFVFGFIDPLAMYLLLDKYGESYDQFTDVKMTLTGLTSGRVKVASVLPFYQDYGDQLVIVFAIMNLVDNHRFIEGEQVLVQIVESKLSGGCYQVAGGGDGSGVVQLPTAYRGDTMQHLTSLRCNKNTDDCTVCVEQYNVLPWTKAVDAYVQLIFFDENGAGIDLDSDNVLVPVQGEACLTMPMYAGTKTVLANLNAAAGLDPLSLVVHI